MSLVRRALLASLALAGLQAAAAPTAQAWVLPDTCSPEPRVCVSVVPRDVIHTTSVATVELGRAYVHAVVGWVEVYRFQVGVGSVAVPCVVLDVGTSYGNPCAKAGGQYMMRVATLVDTSLLAPEVGPMDDVNVCTAAATVTVANVGLVDFPAYTIC